MKYNNFDLPDDLLYNKDSSWVRVEGNTAIIGVIEPIAKILKEFLFVKLPEKKFVKKNDVYVSLETLKWSGHLTCPLSGEIVDINNALYDEPSKINEQPYASWIIKLKLSDKKELNSLFKSEKIIGWLDSVIKQK